MFVCEGWPWYHLLSSNMIGDLASENGDLQLAGGWSTQEPRGIPKSLEKGSELELPAVV